MIQSIDFCSLHSKIIKQRIAQHLDQVRTPRNSSLPNVCAGTNNASETSAGISHFYFVLGFCKYVSDRPCGVSIFTAVSGI